MKDFLLSILVVLITGFFGGGILIGIEITNWLPVVLGTLAGCALGTWFKEWRRFAEKPKYWYVPYIIGTIIITVLNLILAHAQAASIAA